jgi:hypothetical protein
MKIIHWTIKITLENGETEFLSDAPDWVAKPVDEYLNALESTYEENRVDSQINIMKDEQNRGPE